MGGIWLTWMSFMDGAYNIARDSCKGAKMRAFSGRFGEWKAKNVAVLGCGEALKAKPFVYLLLTSMEGVRLRRHSCKSSESRADSADEVELRKLRREQWRPSLSLQMCLRLVTSHESDRFQGGPRNNDWWEINFFFFLFDCMHIVVKQVFQYSHSKKISVSEPVHTSCPNVMQ